MATLSIETRKLYKQLHMDISSLHWRASIVLKLYKESEQNRRTLANAAGSFFDRVLENDMYDAIVLNIARLLDPAHQGNHSNATLERLIEDIQPIKAALAAQVKLHLDNLRQNLPPMENWRNKWACHRDYPTMLALQTPTASPLRPRFTRDQLAYAMAELDAFLNDFESAFQDKEIILPAEKDIVPFQIPEPTVFRAFDASDEIDRMLKLLQTGIEGSRAIES